MDSLGKKETETGLSVGGLLGMREAREILREVDLQTYF
jgi:hypothetical protein